MYSPYRSRSQTKKRCSNCKPKITAAEKRQRSIAKKLAKIFPYRQFHLHIGKQKSIYQHSLKEVPSHGGKSPSLGGGFRGRPQ